MVHAIVHPLVLLAEQLEQAFKGKCPAGDGMQFNEVLLLPRPEMAVIFIKPISRGSAISMRLNSAVGKSNPYLYYRKVSLTLFSIP